MNTAKRKHVYLKLPIILVIVTALLLIGSHAMIAEWNHVISEKGENALNIAKFINLSMDKERYVEIMKTGIPDKEYHKFQSFISDVLKGTDSLYIYIMNGENNGHYVYYMEGNYDHNNDKLPLIKLWETESAEYHHSLANTSLRKGVDLKTGAYTVPEYGRMVSGFSAILDSNGYSIGIIGVDLPIDGDFNKVVTTGIINLIITLISFSLVFIILLNYEKMTYRAIAFDSINIDAMLEKKISEELQKESMQLKLLIKGMGIGLWDMKADVDNPIDGNNDFWRSDEIRELLGYQDERDFPNTFGSWTDRIHPDDKNRVLNHFKAHVLDRTGRTPYNIRYRMLTKRGDVRHFHSYGSTERDEHGLPIRVAGGIIDITEEILIEEKMAEAEERTQIMLDATPLCCNLWDKDLNNIDCNQEAVTLFDLSSKQEYLDKFFELSPKYQPCGTLSTEKAAINIHTAFSEGYCRFEWMHQKLNGEKMPCEITLVRVKYKDHFIVAGYTRDLRDLKTQAQWFQSILDSVPFPITVTNWDKTWAFANIATEKFINRPREELYGKVCTEEGTTICKTHLHGIESAEKGIGQTFFEYEGVKYRIDTTILKDLNGIPIGHVALIENLSDKE